MLERTHHEPRCCAIPHAEVLRNVEVFANAEGAAGEIAGGHSRGFWRGFTQAATSGAFMSASLCRRFMVLKCDFNTQRQASPGVVVGSLVSGLGRGDGALIRLDAAAEDTEVAGDLLAAFATWCRRSRFSRWCH